MTSRDGSPWSLEIKNPLRYFDVKFSEIARSSEINPRGEKKIRTPLRTLTKKDNQAFYAKMPKCLARDSRFLFYYEDMHLWRTLLISRDYGQFFLIKEVTRGLKQSARRQAKQARFALALQLCFGLGYFICGAERQLWQKNYTNEEGRKATKSKEKKNPPMYPLWFLFLFLVEARKARGLPFAKLSIIALRQ